MLRCYYYLPLAQKHDTDGVLVEEEWPVGAVAGNHEQAEIVAEEVEEVEW